MTEPTSEANASDEAEHGYLDSKRRSVLRGATALGLSGSVVGSAVARDGGDEAEGEPKGEPGEKSEGEEEPGCGATETGVPSSIQFYTLRHLPDTVPQLIDRVGAVDNNGGPGYDSVEFAGLGDASVEEVAQALERTGFQATGGGAHSAHVGLEQLTQANYQQTVETYRALGVDTFVVPYAEGFGSVESIRSLAERMNRAAARLDGTGVRLGYHNHNQEFQTVDGELAFDVFERALDDDVVFEIDVGWVLVGGHDPAEVIAEYSDRTELVHMKDMKVADGVADEAFDQITEDDYAFAEIGEGDVDLVEVSRVAREEAGVDYLIYEHDEPANPAGSAATGAGVLSLLDGEEGLECVDLSDMGGPGYDGDLSGEG